jgi:hypothetical protein
LAANFFAQTFFSRHPAVEVTKAMQLVSPFGAAFSIPLTEETQMQRMDTTDGGPKSWWTLIAYLAFTYSALMLLLLLMVWLFNVRWRVSQ